MRVWVLTPRYLFYFLIAYFVNKCSRICIFIQYYIFVKLVGVVLNKPSKILPSIKKTSVFQLLQPPVRRHQTVRLYRHNSPTSPKLQHRKVYKSHIKGSLIGHIMHITCLHTNFTTPLPPNIYEYNEPTQRSLNRHIHEGKKPSE